MCASFPCRSFPTRPQLLIDPLVSIHLFLSNWGTEQDAEFSYANGNSDPGRGFGHVAIIVDDLEAACERFESFGDKVKWVKRPKDGKMNNIAFIADPDGYWVEVLKKSFA